MIKLERFEVMNMNNAIRGARNPLNSWARMDSYFDEEGKFVFGPNDLDLAKRLCKAGSDHRKFIRQIFVTVDITAPLYWWKEYDTYKVGTVANSTSTMHKIHAAPFGEGLQRIENGAACVGGKRIERHAPRGVGDDGSCRQGQRRGYLPDGLVAHRDQVYVRVGQPCRVCRPLRSGECGDSLPPCGVAGEQLYQLQAASGDGLCQCFGKVSAADDHYAFQRSLHIVLQ